jgi:hypothetical protein
MRRSTAKAEPGIWLREAVYIGRIRYLAGLHDQIAKQALTILEVNGDPRTAMQKQNDAWPTSDVFRLHHIQLHLLSILGDRYFGRRYP